VPCRQCRKPIPKGARLCSECKSYQDWRGYLNVSSTVLALLVALISVIGGALPHTYHLFGWDKSKVVFGVPVVSGERVRLFATNKGAMPAVLRKVFYWDEPGGVIVEVPIPNTQTAVISSSPNLIELPIPLRMTAGDADTRSEYFFGRKDKDERATLEGILDVSVLNSDGSTQEAQVPIPYNDLGTLYDAHLDLCSIDKPDRPQKACALGAEAEERAQLRAHVTLKNRKSVKSTPLQPPRS
jgi:hypothetical protein